ncbi:hypothetical protein GCM10007103_29900 [Salinimicrobium marinum]|uniref:DUF2809 domain-containing protein n=1 Tax=Salinimicrobium marinum TaxID=680283 RepID=A0A918SKC4_9FLAO|nr:DUF2809 domain-containing protein [Salinimicrobium marinum]GHA46859.1 hypothetical protein GCM10007103_29900 [Salinimicrobium marinum]
MYTFKKNYFFVTVLLLLIEVFIAMFVRDRFIRPYAGDFLVVILLYSFLKSFLKISVLNAAFSVLLFACLVEVLQILNLADLPWFENRKLVLVVLGSHFEWLDMLAYSLGIIVILGIEKFRKNPKPVF